MRRPRRPPGPSRASVNLLARWRELSREMAMGQGREYQSIYRFVVRCQRLAVTNRAPAAAGKNIRTAAAESPDILIPAHSLIGIEAARADRLKVGWIRYA